MKVVANTAIGRSFELIKSVFQRKSDMPSASVRDADRLDGLHASDLALRSHTHTKAQITNFEHTHTYLDLNNAPNGSYSNGFINADKALFSAFRGSRLAFILANDITIEKSTDGGTSWEDYGASDDRKAYCFIPYKQNGLCLGGHGSKNQAADGDMLSITAEITDRYVSITKYYIWCSTNGVQRFEVRIEGRRASGAWEEVINWVPIYGWSGANEIITTTHKVRSAPLDAAYEYSALRFIFRQSGCSNAQNYSSANLHFIEAAGDNCWGAGHGGAMADYGHLYDMDANRGATFPAMVKASSLVKSGGTSSQLLCADGSVEDKTAYAKKDASNVTMDNVKALIDKISRIDGDIVDADRIIVGHETGYVQRTAQKLWDYVKGKSILMFAGLIHTHAKSQITDFAHSHQCDDIDVHGEALDVVLEGKAATNHTHPLKTIDGYSIEGTGNIQTGERRFTGVSSVVGTPVQPVWGEDMYITSAVYNLTIASPAAPTIAQAGKRTRILFHTTGTPTITYPSTWKWAGDNATPLWTGGKCYEIELSWEPLTLGILAKVTNYGDYPATTQVQTTLTISASPVTSEITFNGIQRPTSGDLTHVQATYTVTQGTQVQWRVSAVGYSSQHGTWDGGTTQLISVTLKPISDIDRPVVDGGDEVQP